MSADDEEASREAAFRLVSEEFAVHRTVVCGDVVRVRTATTESVHTVEEILRHQTADIRRVPIGREIGAMPAIRQEGDLTVVPVVKEVLVLRRQLVLVEEIHIRRVSTDEPFTADVTLREQRAEITRHHPADGAAAARPIDNTKV